MAHPMAHPAHTASNHTLQIPVKLPNLSSSNSASSVESSSERQSTLNASTLNAGAPAFESTSLWVSSDQAVFLQTAQAQVFNLEAPQNCKQVRIVLGCGSQRSYISDGVARDLSLK